MSDFFNGWPEDGEPVMGMPDILRDEAKDPLVTEYMSESILTNAADRLDLLEKALVDIINMKSCLLADAREIAKEALRETE